jgi:hypothetical protein
MEGHVQRSAFDRVWKEWQDVSAKTIIEKELMARIAGTAGLSLTSMIKSIDEKNKRKYRGLLKMKRADTLSERIAKGEWYKQSIGRSAGVVESAKAEE